MGIGNNAMNKIESELTLVFHIGLDSFSYAILNKKRYFKTLKIVDIDENNIELEIIRILNSTQALKQIFQKSIGSIDKCTNTFIPKVLFNHKYIKDYINFNSTNTKQETHLYNEQVFTQCYSIFSIQTNILNNLKKSLSNLDIKHTSSVFVDYAIKLSKKDEKHIFIQVNKQDFHIAYIENLNFIFYNQFEYNNNDDFLYHYLNCLNVLALDHNDIKINIMSVLEKNHIIFQMIRKYTPNHRFLNRLNNFHYSNQIIQSEEHKNHNIFSQLICE